MVFRAKFPPHRLASLATSPPLRGGEEPRLRGLAPFLAPFRGRGGERSEPVRGTRGVGVRGQRDNPQYNYTRSMNAMAPCGARTFPEVMK
jgi:hypothetical protein